MEMNGIHRSAAVPSYEPAVAKPKETPVKVETQLPQDKVEISAEAKIAADVKKIEEDKAVKPEVSKMTAEERAELVTSLKAQMEIDQAKMFDFARNTLATQGLALEKADDIWQFIASGKYEVDEETKTKAKEAIEDGGYYSVEETSNRLYDFAMALSGGDADKMKKLESAFEEGFKKATKSWGKELPDISNRTYDAVKEKFKAFYESTGAPGENATTE